MFCVYSPWGSGFHVVVWEISKASSRLSCFFFGLLEIAKSDDNVAKSAFLELGVSTIVPLPRKFDLDRAIEQIKAKKHTGRSKEVNFWWFFSNWLNEPETHSSGPEIMAVFKSKVSHTSSGIRRGF